jgi:hypothetical protein
MKYAAPAVTVVRRKAPPIAANFAPPPVELTEDHRRAATSNLIATPRLEQERRAEVEDGDRY